MASVAPLVINIDAWSDIACPWCYVGKTRLDQAVQTIEASAGVTPTRVVVKWHPYMIDLRTNPAGEEYLAYNRRRWGSDSWTQSLRRVSLRKNPPVTHTSGATCGLKFTKWQWWPNTLHAHRLIHLADKFGKGAEAKQLLLLKTYEEGLNISSLEVLLLVAKELGLPEADEYLRSEQGRKEVLEQDKHAKSNLGIQSVPHFIIDNKYPLSGAQDVKTFEKAIRKVIGERLQQVV